MSLVFNGIAIPTTGSITFDGTAINTLVYNGTTYWQADSGGGLPSPTWLTASDGDFENKIQIFWDDQSLSNIEWSIYRNGVVIDTIVDTPFYDDTTALPGNVYTYKVQGCETNGDECTGFSPEDSGFLDDGSTIDPPVYAPSSFNATDGTSYDFVGLSWNNGSETNADNITIERRESGSYSIIAIVPFGVTSYQDVGATPGTVYTYRSYFTNDSGNGPYSNEDSGHKSQEPTDVPPHTHNPDDIIPQGSGSGLDADLLDGYHSTQFATSSHTHDDRYYTEIESDSKFANINHNHDGTYSPVSHNHNGVYHPYGGSMTEYLYVPSTPSNSNHAASKAYVDSQLGGSGDWTLVYNGNIDDRESVVPHAWGEGEFMCIMTLTPGHTFFDRAMVPYTIDYTLLQYVTGNECGIPTTTGSAETGFGISLVVNSTSDITVKSWASSDSDNNIGIYKIYKKG